MLGSFAQNRYLDVDFGLGVCFEQNNRIIVFSSNAFVSGAGGLRSKFWAGQIGELPTAGHRKNAEMGPAYS